MTFRLGQATANTPSPNTSDIGSDRPPANSLGDTSESAPLNHVFPSSVTACPLKLTQDEPTSYAHQDDDPISGRVLFSLLTRPNKSNGITSPSCE